MDVRFSVFHWIIVQILELQQFSPATVLANDEIWMVCQSAAPLLLPEGHHRLKAINEKCRSFRWQRLSLIFVGVKIKGLQNLSKLVVWQVKCWCIHIIEMLVYSVYILCVYIYIDIFSYYKKKHIHNIRMSKEVDTKSQVFTLLRMDVTLKIPKFRCHISSRILPRVETWFTYKRCAAKERCILLSGAGVWQLAQWHGHFSILRELNESKLT